MSENQHPTPLDPLGSLIYYLCVTRAMEAGGLILPSSQTISSDLATEIRDGKKQALNPRVQSLWEDLQWINQQGLLFHEHPYQDSEFYRSLSQHNVNQRIRDFRPGFEQINKRTRRLILTHVVEKTGTAARLVAVKDAYHFNKGEPSQKTVRELMLQHRLIMDADQYYTFLESAQTLEYIDSYPRGALAPPIDRNRHFAIELTDLYRGLDMYIELRALDYFSDCGSRREGRERRLHLNACARSLASGAKDS